MRKPRSKRTTSQLTRIQREIKKHLEPWAEYLVDQAFSDQDGATIKLCNVFPNGRRGWLVVAFWLAGAPTAVFRKLLLQAWQHDHDDVIDAVKKLHRLKAVFRYASFESAELPSIVTLYRGTATPPDGLFRAAYSWTRDIKVAHGFALRCACEGRAACLLEIQVRTNEMEAHFLGDEMDEKEVVLLEDPNIVYAAARKTPVFSPKLAIAHNAGSDDFDCTIDSSDSSRIHHIISPINIIHD